MMLPNSTVPEAAGVFAAGAVPVPNVFFDEVLPTLRDTELRVLLIVLRQTAGWRDSQGRPKARDWLSHGQLVRRTGRGSEAVSGAVATLVRRGLVVVETSAATPLTTSEERRRHLGRLYFRPALSGENLGKSLGRPRPGKAKRTTNKENNN